MNRIAPPPKVPPITPEDIVRATASAARLIGVLVDGTKGGPR
ncbi:hypothetical protein ACFVHI_35510 [Kitasatospora sp. NPDC127121]